MYVEPGSDQPFFFIRKADKDECVVVRGFFQTLEQTGQQRTSAPIVDDAFSAIDEIEMCAHDDFGTRAARQRADYVRRLGMFDALFGKIIAGAARFLEQGLQPQFALEIGVLKGA
jgi:hypothetical protein